MNGPISAFQNPPDVPIKPFTPVTTYQSGALVDGSAGVQVTSGVSGSHDVVGINSSVLNSLASVGDPGIVDPTAVPITAPADSGYGSWLLIGAVIAGLWILLK